MKSKYEQDFLGWAYQNAKFLRERRFDELDIENLIEEIESMGENRTREFLNYISTIIAHLLKLKYVFPESLARNERKWKITISTQARKARNFKAENPSLMGQLGEDFMQKAYGEAIMDVADAARQYKDIDLNLINAYCPYTLEECLKGELN